MMGGSLRYVLAAALGETLLQMCSGSTKMAACVSSMLALGRSQYTLRVVSSTATALVMFFRYTAVLISFAMV
jgi:hypothetical protein